MRVQRGGALKRTTENFHMSELRSGVFPVLVSAELETTEDGGSEYVELWEGTQAEVSIKKNVVLAYGANRTRIAPKGDGAWQLRASWPFDTTQPNEGYVDTLELEVNTSLPSLYNSPVYRKKWFAGTGGDVDPVTNYSARANATVRVVEDCTNKIKSGLPRQEASGKFKYLNLAGVEAEYATRELAMAAELDDRLAAIASIRDIEKSAAKYLYQEAAFMDVTGFIEYSSVFRRTVTAGHPSAITANYTGAGMIWTTAEIIAFEGVGAGGWFVLPPDVQWHKDEPRVTRAYGQKTQIAYSYTEITTASALLYKSFGDAVLTHVPTP
jgi:hypothetical protein